MTGWPAHDEHCYRRFVSKVTRRALWTLETREPERLLPERQGVGTAHSGTKCCDHSVGERALSFLECDHGSDLLVLHYEHVGCSTRSTAPTISSVVNR